MIARFKAQVFLQSLRDAERLTAERQAIFARVLLQRLAEHCTQDAFWRDRLAALWQGGVFDFARWHGVPLLTAAEAEALPMPVLSRAAEDNADMLDLGERGGAFRYRDNLSRVADQGAFERICEVYELPLNARLFDIASLPAFEHPEWKWNSTFDKARRIEVPTAWPPEFLVEQMVAYKPTLLRGAPDRLAAAGELLAGSEMPWLRGIIAIGEPMDDASRDLLSRQFGAPVITIWHDPRLGVIAFRGRDDGSWRISSGTQHVEVVDPGGRPSSTGTRGPVAVTPLYCYTCPALRFVPGHEAMLTSGPDGRVGLAELSRTQLVRSGAS